MRGASLAHALRAGRRVVLYHATVIGPVDLDNLNAVKRLFECQECTFIGPVLAHDVVFEGTLDLSGSTFRSPVDFTGATFKGPALFSSALTNGDGSNSACTFAKRALFDLAVFSDLASFDESRFSARADFRDARFSDGTFSSAQFQSAAFTRASFLGVALFDDARFGGRAAFDDVDFARRADFSRANFQNGATFETAHFGDGGSFLAAVFQIPPPPTRNTPATDFRDNASFQSATASGDLNLTFASFWNGVVTLSDLASSGVLTLQNAEFDGITTLGAQRLQVRQFIFDVGSVGVIKDKQERLAALGLIEETAKERQDLRTANNAQYEIRELRAQGYSLPMKTIDYVFFRGVAGYFVRPLRPILVLLLIVTIVASVRMHRRNAEPNPRATDPSPRKHQFLSDTSRRCGTFLTCLLDTFAVAAPRWKKSGDGILTVPERLEVMAYRLLVVCGLIAIANSNPTLRQMLDSLL